MEDNKRSKSNPLKKKIEHWIRRNGFDENYITSIKFHLEVIYASGIDKSKPTEINLESEDDYCNLLMSKLFIDKMDLYPTKRFKCQINECSVWPLPLLPSEIFGEMKLPSDYRRRAFYECLQVDDILDCRVQSVLPQEYHMRVIHKYGATRILDDLKLIVVMPRNKSELALLQKDLYICELIRVAVSEIIKDDEGTRKVCVTVNDNSVELRQYRPQLGRILEEHLPAYVLDPPEPEPCSTYSDYLNSLPSFRNPILINGIIQGFGLNPKGPYSFHPGNEILKPVDGKALLMESKVNDVKSFTDLALQKFDNGDISNAFKFIEYAIKIYPQKNLNKNDRIELSKLYEIRGKMHAESEKPKMSKNALMDWDLAFHTDPNNENVKGNLSKVMFQAAYKFYRGKQYKKAATWTKKSLEFDGSNVKASALHDYLQEKHPEGFINLDDESLLTLQEKKKELVSELKSLISGSEGISKKLEGAENTHIQDT